MAGSAILRSRWQEPPGKGTCQVKRQPKMEQIRRLAAKTLDQVFIARAQEGLKCSSFEVQALTDLAKDVYFPWLTQPEAIQAGQLAMIAVSAEEQATNPYAANHSLC